MFAHKLVPLTVAPTCICPLGKTPIFPQIIVKIRLASQFFIDTILNVIDKSYRQVLTLINNSLLLLKLEILDKFRLVTNQRFNDKGNCNIF
jgi:hypothetical protein